MNIMLFDSQITGHHSEYIAHIVDYATEINTVHNYYFVVHYDFQNKFKSIIENSTSVEHINWVFLSPTEIESLSNLSMIKSSFIIYKLVQKYAENVKADHVHLLYFNSFQLALALKRPKFKVSGILFQQFSRMSKESLKERLKYYRKYYTTKMYSKNRQIESIFILNDKDTSELLNTKFKTKMFKMLPDPIPNLKPLEDFSLGTHYSIDKEKKVLLHFGSLADRKGTFELINSAKYIPKGIQDSIVLLLVGKPDNSETETRIKNMINEISKISNVEIILDNTFVSNEKMKSLFEQSYAVVIPYKNPEASSGILGHAIAAKKSIITTGKGLLREIVEKNDFGILLDSISPENIAQAILKVKKNKSENDYENYTDYIKNHTAVEFAKTIIN